MGVLALFRLVPLRDWLWAGLVVSLVAGGLWYRAHLIDTGRQEVRAAVQAAVDKQQQLANVTSILYESEAQQSAAATKVRVKEVVRYVQVNHSCDLPSGTVRMLNDAIAGHPVTRGAGSPVPASGAPG
jgi:hypothetical protein